MIYCEKLQLYFPCPTNDTTLYFSVRKQVIAVILLFSVSNFIKMFINAQKIGKFMERCFAAVTALGIKRC